MKLQELTRDWVSFSRPNAYVYPHYEECVKACRMYYHRNENSKTRGNVRNRFSHIVAVCKKYSIPMFSYGNNDGGYAYLQKGFALPESYINENVIHDLEPYIDYLDFVAIREKSFLNRTDGEGAFIAIGVRWYKANAWRLRKHSYRCDYFEDARIYDRFFPNYTNK